MRALRVASLTSETANVSDIPTNEGMGFYSEPSFTGLVEAGAIHKG